MSKKPAPNPESSSMSLMGHLVELRNRIFKCAIAITIGAVLGWWLFIPVFDFLTQPIAELCRHHTCLLPDGQLPNADPLDPFTTRIKLSTYIGIGIAMPVLLWQIWRFVAPGLYANERKYTLAFIGPAMALFVFGAWTAYFVLPVSLDWLQGIGGAKFVAAYDSGKFVTLIAWMMLAFGAAFEFPVLLVALMGMRVLKVRTLIRQWRYAVAGIAIVAGVITPTADPFTFLFMAIPMVVLYGISIVIGLLMERARSRAT